MKKILTAILIAPLLAFAAADDGYVESDGTQYVILGHFVGPKTKIEVDFQMTEIGNVRLMGALGEHGISLSRLYIGSGKFSHITSTDENKEQTANTVCPLFLNYLNCIFRFTWAGPDTP